MYLGGHFNYMESPTAKRPVARPGQRGLRPGPGPGRATASGDDIVTRDHIGAIDPATGKALEWNPGSNSFEGNKAMLRDPRGLVTGGDATTQGGFNVGRVAFYDFNSVPTPGANETTITNPIEGRVKEADKRVRDRRHRHRDQRGAAGADRDHQPRATTGICRTT